MAGARDDVRLVASTSTTHFNWRGPAHAAPCNVARVAFVRPAMFEHLTPRASFLLRILLGFGAGLLIAGLL